MMEFKELSGNSNGNKRIRETQSQVNEVVGIMRVNVEKVLERDQKLTELDLRADALQQGATQFHQQSTRLKRKFWWKNLKMMLIMGAVGVVLLIVIITSVSTQDSTEFPNKMFEQTTGAP